LWGAGPAGYWFEAEYRCTYQDNGISTPIPWGRASRNGACEHLTLAANCWIDDDNGEFGFSSVKDYAFRPWRWQEPEVQAAYEEASEGDVTASDVGGVAWVDSSDSSRNPTAAERDLVAQIHSWDPQTATLLAFGPETPCKRPFAWPSGESAMAPAATRSYNRPDSRVYCRGRQHKSYESGEGGWSGQGFISWRPCEDGALDSEDWKLVGNTIHDADIRPETLAAFDLRIRKIVTLVRGKHRSKYGKEHSKRYEIQCWRISGAAPDRSHARVIGL
jgi:hypothetical protein